MNKLQKEIAKVLFRISNKELVDYYGIGSDPLLVEKVLLPQAKWSPEGWKAKSSFIQINKTKTKQLPKFYHSFNGHFDCSRNNLTDLTGSPRAFVQGEFNCSDNDLVSLKGAPDVVGSTFLCGFNTLKDLWGSPRDVGGSFSCHQNKLASLDGAPLFIRKNFWCHDNPVIFERKDLPEDTVLLGEFRAVPGY